MNRIRIDLHRFPVWIQYLIALSVVAIVTLLAWHFRNPTPQWVTEWVVPALSWIGLCLIVTGVSWHVYHWWRQEQ